MHDPNAAGDIVPSHDDDGIDPALLAELEAIFTVEAAARLDELRVALSNGDAHGIQRAAHRLAGDAAAIGLLDVEHDARAILLAARAEHLADVPPLLAQLTVRLEGRS